MVGGEYAAGTVEASGFVAATVVLVSPGLLEAVAFILNVVRCVGCSLL